MTGGLTTYPRTSGGGGSILGRIHRMLRRLTRGSLPANEETADSLIAALEAYALERAAAQAYAETISMAVRIRDALFAARVDGKLAGPYFVRAMEICSTAFRVHVPLAATGYASRSAAATAAAMELEIGMAKLRGLKEELGVIAWLYETSALLGEDLSATLGACTVDVGNRFVEGRPAMGGRLQYLEAGSAYNVNLMVCARAPGCALPLVIAGEAKGGASGYGEVVTPKDMERVLFIRPPVKQNSIDYIRTRALYMKRERGTSAALLARREAGELIDTAGTTETLVFVAARGDLAGGKHTTIREYLQCP